MATDHEVVSVMNTWLRARGYTCGRSYSDVGNVVDGIKAELPSEDVATLKQKVSRLSKESAYGFKTRGVDEISASNAADPECG